MEEKENLLNNSNGDQENPPSIGGKLRSSSSPWLKLSVISSCVLNIVLLGALAAQLSQRRHDPSQLVYSPAQHVIEYRNHVFNEAFEEQKTIYQGIPNDAKDKLWLDLWLNISIQAIPATQAHKFANKTERVPWEPNRGELMTGLSVGHQLHCLDVIRQGFWPERYNNSIWKPDGTFDYMAFGHIDHCIDMLRQTIECNCDVTPIAYHWNERLQKTRAHFDTLRTCKNCARIREWANQYTFHGYKKEDRFLPADQDVPIDMEPDLASFAPDEDFSEIEVRRAQYVGGVCQAV